MSPSRRAPLLLTLLALPAVLGCSVGQGTGDVHTRGLFARDCWGVVSPTNPEQAIGACYNMQPNFFGANPDYNSLQPNLTTLQITVQNGSDSAEVSDGLLVSIDDLLTILDAIQAANAADAGAAAGTDAGSDAGADGGTGGDDYGLSDGGATEPTSCDGDSTPMPGEAQPTSCDGVLPPAGKATFRVDLPAGVVPPGSPSVPPPDILADPPIVHMALYLGRSCHNQNTILYAVDGWIAFNAVFDGNPDETQADQKLTDATFNVEFGDIRDVPFGDYAGDVPPGLRSRICGSFKFYFERGQPAQPFP